MLNGFAISGDVAPKDGDFGFKVEELEALLPAGTVDRSMKRVYEEVCFWSVWIYKLTIM